MAVKGLYNEHLKSKQVTGRTQMSTSLTIQPLELLVCYYTVNLI